MGTSDCLITNILQNTFFCVQQKKETQTGLEQLKGEQKITEYSFLDELFLNNYEIIRNVQLF